MSEMASRHKDNVGRKKAKEAEETMAASRMNPVPSPEV
jgi:hypothetical protein